MREKEVSGAGIFAAAVLALVGTIGHYATAHSAFRHDDEWFLIFAVAILTLCASAVNFQPKRWFR
jgi:hypothetical protein